MAKENYSTRVERVAIGEKLKAARKQLGIGQIEVSEKIGISQPQYSNLEKGKTDQGREDAINFYIEQGIEKSFFKIEDATTIEVEHLKKERDTLKAKNDDLEKIIHQLKSILKDP